MDNDEIVCSKAPAAAAVHADVTVVQESPPSRLWRTSYDVISKPPAAGATHTTARVPSPAASAGAEGFAGGPVSVARAESDHSPSPAAFTARTCTR